MIRQKLDHLALTVSVATEHSATSHSYLALVRKLTGNGEQTIFNIDPTVFFDVKVVRTLAAYVDLATNTVVSGAYAFADGSGSVRLQGVATDPDWQGMGLGSKAVSAALVGHALQADSDRFGLVVRMVAGEPAPAYRMYTGLSFVAGAPFSVPLTGTFVDGHIREDASLPMAGHISVLPMTGDVEVLRRAALKLWGTK